MSRSTIGAHASPGCSNVPVQEKPLRVADPRSANLPTDTLDYTRTDASQFPAMSMLVARVSRP